MRFRNQRLFGMMICVAVTCFAPVAANAATIGANAGISANLSEKLADTKEHSKDVHAGISSALSSYIDVSTARATISTGDYAYTTSSGIKEIAGYTNLGIAQVEGNLNVRKEPDEGAELVGKMPGDAGCEILGTEGDWSKIQSGDVEGYVKSEFLLTGAKAKEYAPSVISTIAKCGTEVLNVRKEPNTECEIIAQMAVDEEVEVLEDLGDWAKVSVDSEEGYISKEFVEIGDQLKHAMTMKELSYGQGVSDTKVNLVSYACQFVGNPYVWGGTSLTNGADCSGFTMSIFAKYGVYLPHSSAAQSGMGRAVSAGEAQPGDLFFYGSGSHVSHVAIYIGNGQIVHASSARTGIKISNAYYRSPICVKRFF